MSNAPTLIIGAGLAGLSSAIALSARGEKVMLLEKESYPGGKMRRQMIGDFAFDAGPTVFTMRWVFDRLFDMAGTRLENEIGIEKATVLARHAWDDSGHFDLFADQAQTEQEVARIFGGENAAGFKRFCIDSKAIFETLKDTFIAAPCPSPIDLVRRVGLSNISQLVSLRPFQTLWRALRDYFPDPRLQQLFGRYATYVGSSPFSAPATLMLIAHVEREGVWFVKGGMHELALAMEKVTKAQGVDIRYGAAVARIVTRNGKATGVELEDGEVIDASRTLYCGDVSSLSPDFVSSNAMSALKIPPAKRSLSAITWSVAGRADGFPLKRHNVFFSDDYRREFDRAFGTGNVPDNPTVYLCAHDRGEQDDVQHGAIERFLCLINAPAFGDRRRLSEEELSLCRETTFLQLRKCGLDLDRQEGLTAVTQPADFGKLFPGSGGALYGAASHGWTASFARPGTRTRLPGLYLAGGGVHPGAGVPMATLSGMLAAEQIIADHGSI